MPADPYRIPRSFEQAVGMAVGAARETAHGHSRAGVGIAPDEFVIGDGVTTVFELFHGLGRSPVRAEAFGAAGLKAKLSLTAHEHPSDDVVRVTFAAAPGAGGAVVLVW